MSTGRFINFVLPFLKDSVQVPAQNQANDILQKSRDLINNGSKGVAITYSANYGQTRDIEKAYFTGGWNTRTNGANQAVVISAMESLLGSEYKDLQGKMRVVPITTMNAYDHPIDPWDNHVLMGIVITDLDRIKIYLEGGWDILGWQNQSTVNNHNHPYAVGGGIAQLPQAVSDKIQETLIGYATQYTQNN
jgi:hypothetical protein